MNRAYYLLPLALPLLSAAPVPNAGNPLNTATIVIETTSAGYAKATRCAP